MPPGGEAPGADREPVGYDYGRSRRLGVGDIEAAMAGCAELKQAAHYTAYRVAELIQAGVFEERPAGTSGLAVRTTRGTVYL